MARKRHGVRFAVGSPSGSRSAVWMVWATGDEVYIAARTLSGDVKVSLHSGHGGGAWRYAYTREHVARPSSLVPPGRGRVIAEWQRPPEFAPGLTKAFQIVVPSSEVTEWPSVIADPDGVRWFPPAEGGAATFFTVIFMALGTLATSWPGRRGMRTRFVSRMELPNAETVWVVAHDERLTEEQRRNFAALRVKTRAYAGAVLDAAKSEGAKLGGVAFGHDLDGTRWHVDFVP